MTPDRDTDDFDDDMAADAAPDPKALAHATLQILQADPSKYRTFGPYWPLMKELLKRYYSQENLFLLGPHVDHEAASHMPPHATLAEALHAAVEFHRNCAAYGMGTNEFTDEETGDTWRLVDPDAGGL
jgi:hypothetical protein